MRSPSPHGIVTGTGLQLAPQGVWKKILRQTALREEGDFRTFCVRAPGLPEVPLGKAPDSREHEVVDPKREVRAPEARRRPIREGAQRLPRGARPASQDVSPRKGEAEVKMKIAPVWFGGLATSSGKKSELALLGSVFAGRPPTVLFDYDPRCNAAPRDCRRVSDEDLEAMGITSLAQMYFCLQTTKDVHEYNAVVNTFATAGLSRAVGSKFSIYWGPHPSVEMLRSFNPFQKANHFPGSWQLGRKDLLAKNVYRMKRQFPKECSIMPPGFSLPEDGAAWAQAREKNPAALWIWKPINLSCGKGIRLFDSSIAPATEKKLLQRSGVVQRYVDRPLLVNGFKFDLRLYVVVTSFDPLKVYINKEGLVRLATQKYNCSPDSLQERTMHLTNYSVNKHAASYKQNLDEDRREDTEAVQADSGADEQDTQEDQSGSSKWSLRQLQEYLATQDVDYDLVMTRIEDLIIKTLIAVEPHIVNTWHQGANFSTVSQSPIQQVGPNQTCFEIYGFDVMVDDELQPWLLEVNIFPSFSSSSPYDKRVKTQLIADVFTLVGLVPHDHDAVEKTCKEEQAKRLQGLPRSLSTTRSHTVSTIKSAPLKSLGEAEWRLILEAHEENMRRGNLTRIYPREGTSAYTPLFAAPRYSNLVLERWIELGGEQVFSLPGIPTVSLA